MNTSATATAAEWSEEDWRLIAESIPHLVWVSGPMGRTLYFNRQAMDYLDIAGADVPLSRFVHPDDLDHAIACWEEARRAGGGYQEDVRLRRADGVYIWHSTRSQPMSDATGAIVRWFGTATDIEARKQVEVQLRDSERSAAEAATLLRTLHGAAPVGFGFVDRHMIIVQMNPELARFTGAALDEQVGRTVADVVPDLWSQLQPIYRHVLANGDAVRNIPLSRPSATGEGDHREWIASFYPVVIGQLIVGVGLVVLDVTERVRAEGFRSTVMAQVADGVYAQDPEGRLTYMNRAASKMLGWEERELRGMRAHDMFHVPKDEAGASPADCVLFGHGVDRRLVRVGDESFRRKDGSTFPVAYSALPLQVGSQVEGLSVVFRDVGDPQTSTNLIRVMIADGDPVSSESLTAMLTRHEGVQVIAVTETARATLQAMGELRPDIVIVDVGLPDVGGCALTARIKEEWPATSVILLALDYDDVTAAGAIAAGCSGIVDKRRTWVELASAVRAAFHGETTISQAELQHVVTSVRDAWKPGRAQDLTAREREVLTCLTQGLSNQQTATKLGVAVNTVRNHVQRILYKLDVHSRLEAVVLATSSGILEVPEP